MQASKATAIGMDLGGTTSRYCALNQKGNRH